MKTAKKVGIVFLFSLITSFAVWFWPIYPTILTVVPQNESMSLSIDETMLIEINQGMCQMTASVYFDKSGVEAIIGVLWARPSIGDTILPLQVRTLERGVPGTLYQVVDELSESVKVSYAGEHDLQLAFDGNCTMTIHYDFTGRKINAVIATMMVSILFFFLKIDKMKAETNIG